LAHGNNFNMRRLNDFRVASVNAARCVDQGTVHAFRDPAGHEAPFWIDFFHLGMYSLVNAQMGALMMIRRFLVSAAALATMTGGALAADLPNEKGPPAFAPPPPPAFSWTGVYIGGQVGYQWGTSSPFGVTVPGDVFAATEPGYNDQGIVGGAHIGYNWQVTQFVFGLEGDVEGTSYRGSGVGTIPAGTGYDTSRANIEASIRARVGWAWDRVLIYATGGGAYASINNTVGAFGAPPTFSSTADRFGWTAGGGIEYAITNNWSARVEYRYTDYGSYDFDVAFAGGVPTAALREHERDNRVEAGFSYKFDLFEPPAPVVAKY
jgi:outer membrane immunogenic protein